MALPSTEPISELILQDVEAALRGIDSGRVGFTYWNIVQDKYVVRYNAGFPTLPGYPACAIAIAGISVDDDLDEDLHSLNTETASLLIEGWINVISDVPKALQRFARDIRTALMEDPRRAGMAIHTEIQSVRFVHAESVTDPYSFVEVQVDVRYRTRVQDLETAG